MVKNSDSKSLLIGIALMCFSAFCTSLGQLLWKIAASNGNAIFIYVGGFALYGFGAVLMIIAFRFGDLSILHPMLSFGFILAIIWSTVILREQITAQKLAGVALIIMGMVFLGFGDRKEAL